MSYHNWTVRLHGEKVQTFLQPGKDDEGYYRKPITEMVIGRDGKPNGQRRVIDWIPVAYFLDMGELRGVIGAGEALRNMSDDEVRGEELWSWVCRNPIPYDVYQAVAENGEIWPDMPKPTEPPRRESVVEVAPGVNAFVLTDNAPKQKTREDYQDEIRAIIVSAPTKIDSDEEVAAAEGIKNRIAELRLEADKVGKSIYQPLHAAYTKEQKAWTPMVTAAKASEEMIAKLVRQYAERKRLRLVEQADAAQRLRDEEEERNARAVDRAIGRGDPEPEPEVEEIVVPSTIVAPIAPDYGTRTVKPEMQTFVTITEEHKVYNYFMGEPELTALLQKLAEKAVKAGRTVPGTTTREGYA